MKIKDILTSLSIINHPNRLIVIAERDVVYSKFPIPLINRLEKHYLVTSASLSSWQTAVVNRLQEWVTNFSLVNVPRHQQMRYVLQLVELQEFDNAFLVQWTKRLLKIVLPDLLSESAE